MDALINPDANPGGNNGDGFWTHFFGITGPRWRILSSILLVAQFCAVFIAAFLLLPNIAGRFALYLIDLPTDYIVLRILVGYFFIVNSVLLFSLCHWVYYDLIKREPIVPYYFVTINELFLLFLKLTVFDFAFGFGILPHFYGLVIVFIMAGLAQNSAPDKETKELLEADMYVVTFFALFFPWMAGVIYIHLLNSWVSTLKGILRQWVIDKFPGRAGVYPVGRSLKTSIWYVMRDMFADIGAKTLVLLCTLMPLYFGVRVLTELDWVVSTSSKRKFAFDDIPSQTVLIGQALFPVVVHYFKPGTKLTWVFIQYLQVVGSYFNVKQHIFEPAYMARELPVAPQPVEEIAEEQQQNVPLQNRLEEVAEFHRQQGDDPIDPHALLSDDTRRRVSHNLV